MGLDVVEHLLEEVDTRIAVVPDESGVLPARGGNARCDHRVVLAPFLISGVLAACSEFASVLLVGFFKRVDPTFASSP